MVQEILKLRHGSKAGLLDAHPSDVQKVEKTRHASAEGVSIAPGFDLSRFAITSSGVVDVSGNPLSFVTNTSEQNAAFLISEIYGGDSDDLLGRLQVSTVGDTQLASQLTNFAGSKTTSLSENSLRIRTYGIVTGDGFIQRIYNEIETTVITLGDVNRDGTVNFLDISPFILVLSGGFQAEADGNADGNVNFLDISPFIILLSGQ